MGRELTIEEKALVESQIANLEIALGRALEKLDSYVEGHVAVPALFALVDNLHENGMINIIASGDLTTVLKKISAAAYLCGFEMGRTNNFLYEFNDLCDHNEE